MSDCALLVDNIDKIHTTKMGIDRIKKNLKLDDTDAVEYCKDLIAIYTDRVKIGTAKLEL